MKRFLFTLKYGLTGGGFYWGWRYYHKLLDFKKLKKGRCPYGCVDFKKMMEDDRDEYLGIRKGRKK